MNIIVTGGAGFIGSHLCKQLLKNGHRVLCIDNFCDYYDPSIKRDNIREMMRNERFLLCEGDIRDRNFLADAFGRQSCELVIHLAAMAGVRPSIENPVLYQDVNVSGTVNILEQCRMSDIKHLVFASSSSVYGNNEKVPFSEDDPVDHPISPYAATKKASELLCHTWHHLFGISILALRFFTVYGPGQRPDLAIHKFTRKITSGEPIQVYGDGTSSRDYTYIDDIVDGIVRGMEYVQSRNLFDVINLGESRTITLTELLETLENELGMKAIRQNLPMQPGDVDRTFADISRARKILGYDPQTSFQEGIRRFVAWYRKR